MDTLLNDFAKPIGYVNDYEKLYTQEQIYEMDSLIYNFEVKTSIQIIIVTFDSAMIKPSEIDGATAAIGNGWKVGGESSKGLVIGISRAYRKMRIENGKTIQKILTDSKTKNIIDTVLIPEFKKGQYYEGTLSGIKHIIYEIENGVQIKF